MNAIRGDLSIMPLSDLLQWARLCAKTGRLVVRETGVEKNIFLKAGRIFFVSSNKEGERLGEYLHRSARIDMDRINAALSEARNMKIPFTQRLMKMNYVTPARLGGAVAENAREIILDASRWRQGEFEFTEGDLPQEVASGPVSLESRPVLEAVLDQLAVDHSGSFERNISFFVTRRHRA